MTSRYASWHVGGLGWAVVAAIFIPFAILALVSLAAAMGAIVFLIKWISA